MVKGFAWVFGLLTATWVLVAAPEPRAQSPAPDEGSRACSALVGQTTPVTRVVEARWIEAGHFGGAPSADPAIPNLGAFCRLKLHSALSSDSSIESEVWLPQRALWNGDLAGIGNGGLAGVIRPGAAEDAQPSVTLAGAVRRGYAAVTTDMGTAPVDISGDSLTGRPVKWLDFSQRSTHEMTLAAKALLSRFYGQAPRKSLFQGCSTGGMQAIAEAELFPQDYDGVLAGDPGNNRSRLFLAIFYNNTVSKLNPAGVLSGADLQLIHGAVLKACAGKGGGTSADGFISSPVSCTWRPAALLCAADARTACLTQAQVDLAQAILDGPRDPVTGEHYYPGMPLGSELGWGEFMTPFPRPAKGAREPEPGFMGQMRWALGPDVDWRKFDWHADAQTFLRIMSPILDINSQDIGAFADRGGKLLIYAGWADTTGSTTETVNYYQAAAKLRRARTTRATAQDALRLFLMPGAGHCHGGNGPNTFDGLGALADWVKTGQAPATIPARYTPVGKDQDLPMTRPLCAFPAVAQYDGHGDPRSAGAFSCSSGRR